VTRSAPPLDTIRRIATPEGIELALRLAGPVPRALAWVIDLLLRLAILLAISSVAGTFGGVGQAVLLISWFVLEWLVPAWCEVHLAGATPGKRALGLMVVHDDGRPIRWGAALTRNLLRAVDFLPAFYACGLVTMLAGRDFKRIGDLAAGTIVVYREQKTQPATVPNAVAAAPGMPLLVTEQRIVLDLAARTTSLTAERAAELAAIPARLVEHTQGAQATGRLLAIANHLLGR
jgi:uncharacterized RDD family membrane protein YckC